MIIGDSLRRFGDWLYREFLHLCNQTVATARHRLDVKMISLRLAECLAQRRHAHGQILLFHFDVGPDRVHDLSLLDYSPAVTDQQQEEFKFRRRQRHRLVVARQAPRMRFQQERAELVD